jgi:hypothetical protein
MLDRLGPATAQYDGRGANQGVKGVLGRLGDVHQVAASEGFFDLFIV